MVREGALKLKAQLFCGDEPAIGPGKADLLEAIDREGSISAAGRSLGMSYRRSWLLVDSMNRCWAERLVETTAGGGAAKGARLTDCGRTVLASYRALERRLADAARRGGLDELTALMRAAPLPPSAKP
ncbi:ModE family transcriptional regulator [Sphingopyxis macrogoltabida]|nr:ModE family transcriptional regulator [Sphingopyxis macrogoltabida]